MLDLFMVKEDDFQRFRPRNVMLTEVFVVKDDFPTKFSNSRRVSFN